MRWLRVCGAAVFGWAILLVQAAPGVAESQIIAIVDHHNLGGLQTLQPLSIHCEPVGSTCTLIAGSAGFVSGFLPSAGLLDDAGNAAQQVLYSQPATPTSLLF